MKKIIAAALALLCLMFCGCKKEESIESVTEKYRDKTVVCTARITAPGEYGGEYTVSFESGPRGDETEILSPSSVAGIKAFVSDGGAVVSYEGKSMEAPFVSYRETAPVSCLSSVFERIRTCAPSVRSKSDMRLDYAEGDVTQSLYFDGEGMLKRAEVQLKGETVLMIEVTSLTLE